MPEAGHPTSHPPDAGHVLRDLARAAERWSASRDPAGEFAEGRFSGTAGLERQRLYERWLGRDTWALFDEGLPLLVGLDPADWPVARVEPAIGNTVRTLRPLLEAALAAGSLPATSRGDAARVEPARLHLWARAQGHAVPDAFETLLQFIATAVRPATAPASARDLETLSAGSGDRERLLGAAFGLLAADGQAGRDDRGWVQAEAIVALLEREAVRWFGQPGLPLSRAAAVELVEQWLA